MKRIKVKRLQPNKLFETWLEEWRENSDQNLKQSFNKALDSLRKYPLPLDSGGDCILLQHFGTKLCKMLDKKLEKYKLEKSLVEKSRKQLSNMIKDNTQNSVSPSIDLPSTVSLAPRNFDIVLLVDSKERSSELSQGNNGNFETLKKENTPFEVRHLTVGDFVWIARCRTTKTELVLPYIVERKRMDDLGSSIRDGRYHEQKFRLKQSGINNITYMIEACGNSDKYGTMPLSTLLQASINSIIQDDLNVKFTRNYRDSMIYLSSFTKALIQRFKDKHLIKSDKNDLIANNINNDSVYLMEFNAFNQASSKIKVHTVKEMFIRQLLQLKGLSLDRVLTIVEQYPTPLLLKQAFVNAGANGEELLTDLKYGRLHRKFGSSLSKTLFTFYTSENLL